MWLRTQGLIDIAVVAPDAAVYYFWQRNTKF
jgi:hypothetical protein